MKTDFPELEHKIINYIQYKEQFGEVRKYRCKAVVVGVNYHAGLSIKSGCKKTNICCFPGPSTQMFGKKEEVIEGYKTTYDKAFYKAVGMIEEGIFDPMEIAKIFNVDFFERKGGGVACPYS